MVVKVTNIKYSDRDKELNFSGPERIRTLNEYNNNSEMSKYWSLSSLFNSRVLPTTLDIEIPDSIDELDYLDFAKKYIEQEYHTIVLSLRLIC